MTVLPFWKMHGAGNDFIVLASKDVEAPWGALAERVCDRHFGAGADGLIVALPSDMAELRMRILNADGSEAEMCGNGIRCLVKFAIDGGLIEAKDGTVRVETIAGVFTTEATRDARGFIERVRVDMGVPRFDPIALGALVEQEPPLLDLPLEAAGEERRATLVSIGNPHAVLFSDEPVTDFPLDHVGPAMEHHPLFAHRTNVEIVRVRDRSHLEMRVWERGVGETLACGSGASAAVVAARLHGAVDGDVAVELPGGTLSISWDGASEVTLVGPAIKVFEAEWSDQQWP